jgi:hypothetical protein
MLPRDDKAILKAHPELVDYLFEKLPNGWIRLNRYWKWAIQQFQQLQESDELGEDKRKDDDSNFLAERIAQWIGYYDTDLLSKIEGHPVKYNKVCMVYAHLVIRHEKDVSCYPILEELRGLRDEVRATGGYFPEVPTSCVLM